MMPDGIGGKGEGFYPPGTQAPPMDDPLLSEQFAALAMGPQVHSKLVRHSTNTNRLMSVIF